MSVINGFLEHYNKKFDFYKEAASICAQICETNMAQIGIRAIVTSRAKKPERLRDKLMKRSYTKNYSSFIDINEDIADLSGVRIALYFPGDLYKVQQFIESTFQVKECKIFPDAEQTEKDQEIEYKKRFSGYWATHYRVNMKEMNLPEESKKYADTLIEIQVASALMHAWAEVEHDLVYKPFSGELSYEEYQILDELNGLVLAGEIALQRLQKAVKNRVSQVGKEFNNHYELAMFLYNKIGSAAEAPQEEIVLGRVDLLFNCIKGTSLNKPDDLKELIMNVDLTSKNKPIVDQIVENISKINPELYEKYRNAKQSEELKYQLETLQMNRENGNRQGEANTLANIGYIYSSKEVYEEALQYFLKAVEINHEIGGRQGEANQLLNVGSTYQFMGELEKALDYCEQAMKLHRQIDYQQGIANTLGMIGNIYSIKGIFKEALNYYTDALTIYTDSNYKIGIIVQLNNIGNLYLKLKDTDQALLYFKQALEICNECDYKQGDGDSLHNIGTTYLEMGNFDEALLYYDKAFSIHAAAGNQKSQIGILISIGNAYRRMGEDLKALKFYKDALLISNNIEFKRGAEESQISINNIQNTTDDLSNNY